MNEKVKARVIKIAKRMVETEESIRELAKVFNISKTTVQKDLSQRLPLIDIPLSIKVTKVQWKNKKEGYSKGGKATAKIRKKVKKVSYVCLDCKRFTDYPETETNAFDHEYGTTHVKERYCSYCKSENLVELEDKDGFIVESGCVRKVIYSPDDLLDYIDGHYETVVISFSK